MAPIRVVVADDHAILREGIKVLLQAQSDIAVVGEAEDGHQAVQRCQELRPDVVLMDIAMPGLGGYEATLEIRRLLPNIRVLVLTQYDNKEYVLRFLRAGAAGYVVKKAVATELLSARLILVGSPTLNNGMLPSMGAFLTYIKGLRPKRRIGLAFGSYGWGGQALEELETAMKDMGWELPRKGINLKFIPDEEELASCRDIGRALGELLKTKD